MVTQLIKHVTADPVVDPSRLSIKSRHQFPQRIDNSRPRSSHARAESDADDDVRLRDQNRDHTQVGYAQGCGLCRCQLARVSIYQLRQATRPYSCTDEKQSCPTSHHVGILGVRGTARRKREIAAWSRTVSTMNTRKFSQRPESSGWLQRCTRPQ